MSTRPDTPEPDRWYFLIDGRSSWHAFAEWDHPAGDTITVLVRAVCGRRAPLGGKEEADRVPAVGHLCGNCVRIIAARTDAAA